MRKYILFFYSVLIVLVVILPMLIIGRLKIYWGEKQDENLINENKSGQTINVYMSKTDEVVAMDMNDYLRGVLPAEMPPTYELEALKAQATVARTYTYYKIKHASGDEYHKGADICDNFAHCQAFLPRDKVISAWKDKGYSNKEIENNWLKISLAVDSTQDNVIMYNGDYIKAFFYANSGGKTESVEEIWGGEKIPYLTSVDSPGEEIHPFFKSEVDIPKGDFEQKVKENVDANYCLPENKKCIEILSYTVSGRVKNVKIGDNTIDGNKMRSIFALKSTNFKIEEAGNSIDFFVQGYGHGVGMSQTGADVMAKNGKTFIDIIKHYYTGVDVKKFD